MSILSKFLSLFTSKKKREDEWAKNYTNVKPAQPSHLIPLDPQDPWKT